MIQVKHRIHFHKTVLADEKKEEAYIEATSRRF